ncbi:interferon alpha-inducible protein 27-like protein 2A [Hypanus sabinus]|uniref:interferon alpha-inducible protein 27-like protein 2A n=1 Tax=Hypanus sabinus TaxID=79690 RepID=UPI0028C4D602|nr:interferon alpha-inducible protein 27-like protein 2A [Hypanus sabinus]
MKVKRPAVQGWPLADQGGWNKNLFGDWSTAAWVAGGAAVAVVGAPIVVSAAGFTGAGIAAGSVGAKLMSAAAIANGGGVAAGGTVAALQSIGAAGFTAAGTAAVGTVGAVAGRVSKAICDSPSDESKIQQAACK